MIEKHFFTIDSDAGQVYCIARYSETNHDDETIHISGASIICPPIGTDYNNSYQNLRVLGEQLANKGQLVIHLDYIEFGNSSEKDEDTEQLESIVYSITSVHSWLKDVGINQINIVGLRFGATLAALAANSVVINKLILWSPVVKGKSFVREIKMLAQASEQTIESSESLDISGWTIEPSTSQAISDIDLLTGEPSAKNIFILQDGQKRQLNKLADYYAKEKSINVTIEEQNELVALLVDAHESQLATESNQSVVDFIVEDIGSTSSLLLEDFRAKSICRGDNYKDSYHYDEQKYMIKTDSLINNNDLPTLVFLNSGSNHQVGPHRLYVTLTREFAKLGFNSFRIDLPGLGETPAEIDNEDNKPYPKNIVATLSSMLKNMGLHSKPLIMVGLCSGAYHSLKFSAEAEGININESIIINPLTFYWQQGMTINDSPSVTFGHWNWYLKSMKDWHRWKKLLKGDVNIKPILKTIQQRFFIKPAQVSSSKPKNHNGWEINADINRTLFKINQRNIQQTFVFSESDPGFGMLRFLAKKAYKKLTKNKALIVHHISNADHTFSKMHARQRLIELLTDHLTKHYVESQLKSKESL
jgi:pimeloyl-ACP methyl ester carboxylesterase